MHFKLLLRAEGKTLTQGALQSRYQKGKAYKINGYSGFRTLNGHQFSDAAILRVALLKKSTHGPSETGRRLQVYALFEKFTERSIKSVMLSQEICRSLGETEVGH